MRKELASSKAKSLNMVGRRIIVQSSFVTVPTYSMQSIAIPVSTCNEIDRIYRNFLWGHEENTRKIHTVNCNDICKPRNMGGLGLRKVCDFNVAFLTKMAWQSNQDKLWVRDFRDKYVKEADFLHPPNYMNGSWRWKSILKGKNIVSEGVKWKVGNRNSINFW